VCMAVLGGLPEHSHPVAGALGVIDGVLDDAAEAPLWSLPDGQVADLVKDVHRVEARLHEVALRLVAEADRRELAKRVGGASTRAWLRRELKVSPAVAKQHVTLAAALAGPLGLRGRRWRSGTSAGRMRR
jgi:hypothetical protein